MKTSSLITNKNILPTLEQPGVNAPGTAKTIIFLPDPSLVKFTLFAGEFSYKSTEGILSPT